VVLLLGAAVALPGGLRPIVHSDDGVTPAAALAAAQRLGLAGPVLNSEGFGGYLVFSGVPVFIDGRVEMYGDDFLAAYAKAERGDRNSLKALLARYRIAWTLLAAPSPAAGIMEQLSGWERVYADRYAVVHRRVDGR
jgi:hypothetical protein